MERITEDHDEIHLNKAFKAIWGQSLEPVIFEKIMSVSERHPYYVNYLCDVLCSMCGNTPSLLEIDQAWNCVVEEERSDLIKDFASLSNNQKRLMIYIATHEGSAIYSAETAKITEMPTGSISRILSSLIEKDYLEKVGENYRLITPVYKKILSAS